MRLIRTLRGVTETRTLDGPVFRAAEARRLASVAPKLAEVYGGGGTTDPNAEAPLTSPVTLRRKERGYPVRGPLELLDLVMAEGERGLSLQRYKGLGEMNPNQLWETTLDPDARTLLQVRIDDMEDANDLFSRLMGDIVEPRRQFIQDNALNVVNLDV